MNAVPVGTAASASLSCCSLSAWSMGSFCPSAASSRSSSESSFVGSAAADELDDELDDELLDDEVDDKIAAEGRFFRCVLVVWVLPALPEVIWALSGLPCDAIPWDMGTNA